MHVAKVETSKLTRRQTKSKALRDKSFEIGFDRIVTSQQISQEDLKKLLAGVTDHEREKRRELSSASEEIAAMQAKYTREIDELETQLRKKDREKRGLEDELRESREELSRERETIRDLKVS